MLVTFGMYGSPAASLTRARSETEKGRSTTGPDRRSGTSSGGSNRRRSNEVTAAGSIREQGGEACRGTPLPQEGPRIVHGSNESLCARRPRGSLSNVDLEC